MIEYRIDEVEYSYVKNYRDNSFYMKEILYFSIKEGHSKLEEWNKLISFMEEDGYYCFYDYDYSEFGDDFESWRFEKEKRKN